MTLVDALFEQQTGSGTTLRDGIVAAVSPFTIIVPPSTVASPAAKLDSCDVEVGSFVQVLVQGANRLVIGTVGGGWHTYTPVVKYGTTTAGLVSNDSRWCRVGNLAVVQVAFKINTGGVGGITATRPVVGRMSTQTFNYAQTIGTGALFTAAGAFYAASCTANAAGGGDFTFRSTTWPSTQLTHASPTTVVANDEYYATLSYEIA